METCSEMLAAGLIALNLPVETRFMTSLLDFTALMEKWNKTYNLTAIRRKQDMVGLHLLDSLAMMPYIEGKRVIDIGTGAGLPGIPLAICRPDIEFTLLDCNAKKTRFVQQAILELKLENVVVCHQRVEDYHPGQGFDSVITRAFANLADIIALTAHLLAKDGVLLAMKGQNPVAELAQVAAKTTVIPIRVPVVAAERCLIRVESLA